MPETQNAVRRTYSTFLHCQHGEHCLDMHCQKNHSQFPTGYCTFSAEGEECCNAPIGYGVFDATFDADPFVTEAWCAIHFWQVQNDIDCEQPTHMATYLEDYQELMQDIDDSIRWNAK